MRVVRAVDPDGRGREATDMVVGLLLLSCFEVFGLDNV